MENGDLAAALIDTLNEAAVRNIRQAAKTPTLLFSGHCYFCDEEVTQPRLFCDVDCRDDHEKEQRLRRSAGRR